LGLAIARQQVEFMDGKLELRSEPDCGSRFFFSVTIPPAREAPVTSDGEELPPLDFSRLTLPDELSAQLTVAAELHSTTVLKSHLDEVRRLGPGGELLARHLRRMIRAYDMDGILEVLLRIRTAEQPGAARDPAWPLREPVPRPRLALEIQRSNK
jgi:hypothetical protein